MDNWEQLRWRNVKWELIPGDSRMMVVPYLDVVDNVAFNTAMSNKALREDLLKCYETNEIPAFDSWTFTDYDNFKGLKWAIKVGIKPRKLTLVVDRPGYKGGVERQPDFVLRELLGRGEVEIAELYLESSSAKDTLGLDINRSTSSTLHLAVKMGFLPIVKSLLQKGTDTINMFTVNGMSPLHSASEKDQPEMVRLLVEHGALINLTSRFGKTALFHAVANSHVKTVDYLLRLGADPNHGSPIITTAVRCRNLEILNLLIAAGVNLDTADHKGYTALSYASSAGQIELVKALLNGGAQANLGNHDEVPLHLAAENDYPEVVKTLLDGGADVNKAMTTGETPLFIASERGLTDMAGLLIERGADVNKATNKGATPLYIAACMGRDRMTRMLIGDGADTEITDNLGNTALSKAACHGRLSTVRLLLEAGADPTNANGEGYEPLHTAASLNHLEVVSELVTKGVGVDAVTRDGSTPLHIASERAHVEVIQILLEGLASIDKAADNGETPLIRASFQGHLEVVKLLLERGAAVDRDTNEGCTALYIASNEGRTEIVRALMNAGADASIANTAGKTPRDAATDPDIVGLLLAA